MELVIKIPEEIYLHLLARYKYQNTDDIGLSELDKVGVLIKNGTPLPKGHGRIIDESQIRHIECHTERELYGNKIWYVKTTDAPTIIEADKESDSGE